MTEARLAGVLLAAAAAYFALLYLVVFWKLWRHQRVPVHRHYEELGASGMTVPSSTRSALAARTQELAALGWQLRGMFVNTGYDRVSIVQAVHGTPDGRVTVSALALVKSGQPSRRRIVLKLDSRRADGSYLSTHNSPQNVILPRDPNVEFHQFPQVHDAGRLIRVHDALIARHQVAVLPRVPEVDLMHWIAARADAESARQCELGTFRRDGEVYRLTLKGSLWAMWRLAPPSSWLLRGLTRARAARLLDRLEKPRVDG